MVINFRAKFINKINFRANTAAEKSDLIANKNLVQFSGSKLSGLECDVVSIDESYLNKSEIHTSARKFSDALRELSKTDSLTPLKVQKIAKEVAPNCDIDVANISSEPRYADRIAVCDTDYLKNRAHSVLYINFDVASDRIIQNSTHEFTHALQDNTCEAKVLTERSRRYGSVAKLSSAFVDFEKQFLDLNFFNGVAQRADRVLDKLNNSKDSNPLEPFSFNNEDLCQKYDLILSKVLDKHDLKNEKFACEFFKTNARDEAEAYKEGFLTKKELANIPQNQYIIQDLLPKMYEDLANYFERKSSSL